MELFTAAKYIQYFLFSRHRKGHGIHSPFVFDLITRILRNKRVPDFVQRIESIRENMKSDPGYINVEDFGSGSRRIHGTKRKISDIARFSAVPEKCGLLLSQMAEAFGYPLILEFGTSFGISTMYMASARPDVQVYTMEGSPEICAVAERNFSEAATRNIRLMRGSFDSLMPSIKGLNMAPGLVFIDGDHRKEPLLKYFNQIAEISGNNTVVIIDDIYSGKEMADAWNIIKNHPEVSVTVDIFRMGIVFFRKGIAKANCVVRY